MPRRVHALAASLLTLALLACPTAADSSPAEPPPPQGQMHFPDIHGDTIVFSHAGDLWTVSAAGGVARRLTTHPGQELFARFSPDGTQLAFTAQYDGEFHVYVMPAAGGEPRQLTWAPDMAAMPLRMGPNDMVIDWTPDGRILFLSRRHSFTPWFGHHWVVSPEGGLPERYPLPKGGLLSFDPSDGNPRLVYNRIFRNFRTWKRYKGGMAQDLWLWDARVKAAERLTDWVGTDTSPMWVGDAVYFISDRGEKGRLNLYRVDPDTKAVAQLTDFEDFDVLWPAAGAGTGDPLVFEKGGALFLFPLPAGPALRLTVSLPGDRPEARPRNIAVGKKVSSVALAPGGQRAAVTARGEVFTAPLAHGPTRNVTRTAGANERGAVWSPDGRTLAFLSDESGEDEIWLASALPAEKPEARAVARRQLTRDATTERMQLDWAPDSGALLCTDRLRRLWIVDAESGEPRLVDTDSREEIRHFAWSPDSRWVAWARTGSDARYRDIWLFDVKSGEKRALTTADTNDIAPMFSADGRYLFFVSERHMNPVLGTFDFTFAYPKAHGIYAVGLRAEDRSPFIAASDEAIVSGGGAGDGSAKGDGAARKKAGAVEVRVDWEGIAARVSPLPGAGQSLQWVAVNESGILYVSGPPRGLKGPLAGEKPTLHLWDLEKRKDVTLLTGVASPQLSPDGGHLVVKMGGAYKVAKLGRGPIDKGKLKTLSLAGLQTRIDPPAEWAAMFHHAWRLIRDRFYQPSLNGVDWDALRASYGALLGGVKTRFDLALLIGELLGELGNSHAYVNAGEGFPLPKPHNGTLGVDLELDTDSGRYRIARILPGQNWRADRVAPLTAPGVSVAEGEYLLAIDGRELRAPTNPWSLLAGAAGGEVTLTVGPRPDGKKARFARVTALKTEYGLRYLDWIATNRARVERLSGGRVGYAYVPNMGAFGLNEFVEQYFPQIRKEGMVIDVRYNGGGFVDQLIFDRLRRVVRLMALGRNRAEGPFRGQAFAGHMACVTNAYAASDGDIFSWFFKEYALGPLVGTRTWGGVRGIRGFLPLLDGDGITVPEFSVYGLDGEWIMENWGVEPQIELDNLPGPVLAGRDPQLEKTTELVLEAIAHEPVVLPKRPKDLPAYPPKGR